MINRKYIVYYYNWSKQIIPEFVKFLISSNLSFFVCSNAALACWDWIAEVMAALNTFPVPLSLSLFTEKKCSNLKYSNSRIILTLEFYLGFYFYSFRGLYPDLYLSLYLYPCLDLYPYFFPDFGP